MGHYILVEKEAKFMKRCWKCKFLPNQIVYIKIKSYAKLLFVHWHDIRK